MLQADKAQLQQAIARLTAEKGVIAVQNAQLLKRLQSSERQQQVAAGKAENALSDVQRTLANVQKEHEGVKSDSKRLQADKEQLERKNKQLDEKRKQSVEDAAAQVNLIQELKKKHNNQRKDLQEEVRKLQADLTAESQLLSVAQKQLSEMQPMSTNCKRLEADCSQKAEELKQVCKQLEDSLVHIGQLAKDPAKQAQQYDNSHAAAVQLTELQHVHAQYQPSRAALAQDWQQAQHAQQERPLLEQQLKVWSC